VDELLEKARLSLSADERASYYKEFQELLAEEAPAAFLYSPAYTYAVSRRVKGVDAATIFSPSDRFADVAKWYIETKSAWK
jgi:peptide/nickel transport system substrate-binding protein